MSSALDLIDRANSDCVAIAGYLLGDHNKAMSNASEMRFSESGKISVAISGGHRGKWKDWSSDEHGDMLDLVQLHRGLDRSGALAWLSREWFGGTPIEPIDRKAQDAARAAALVREIEQKEQKVERAGDIWRASKPFAGSMAERYLVGRLGGRPVDPDVVEGGALRWNSEFRMPGSIGAMIALMTNPETNEPCGIHASFITSEALNLKEMHKGKRISVRRMHGRMGVVRLWPNEAVEMFLAIGEGIESTLAGTIQTNEFPAWAALNAGKMASFPVLAGLEGLRLFVDNDPSGVGQRAAEACSLRYWDEAQIRTRMFIPESYGDFNDVLIGDAA